MLANVRCIAKAARARDINDDKTQQKEYRKLVHYSTSPKFPKEKEREKSAYIAIASNGINFSAFLISACRWVCTLMVATQF